MLVGVDVLVLGPVQALADGAGVTVDRPLERAVLVRLALANRVPVPDRRLAEDLWGAEVERPVQRLRVVVSRLRSALGPLAEVIERTPAGYQAVVSATDLLAAEAAAQRLHAARRAGDYPAVAAAAREALALWRGHALADLRTIPFAAAEGERLDDWRLSLTVAGLEANLELGAAGEVVTELTGLVARHPLHEPLSCLLALALYRTGRQADALDRLARLRRVLSEELGVDPSPDTAALEMRILDHDPSLRAAAAGDGPGQSARSVAGADQVSPNRAGASFDARPGGFALSEESRSEPQHGAAYRDTGAVGTETNSAGAVGAGTYSAGADGAGTYGAGTFGAGADGAGTHSAGAGGSGVNGAGAGDGSGSDDSTANRSETTEHRTRPPSAVAVTATSFVGRGREFTTLTARLAAPGLTTVVGVAGSGKSRLAIELARSVCQSGRPVTLVELAPLGRAEDVLPAVAAALEAAGLVSDASIDPNHPLPGIIEALGREAATPPPLLILDNAEHLLGPVAELVGVATGFSVLVTSQRPVGAPAESVYPLGPLDRSVGVALFIERAGLHGLVTASEREELVAICAAVDWLPLGIELAAGLTRTLTISQLAQRIDDRVRLLVGGARDAAGGRHTSLRVALDWSHELLAERERTVLRRLGVFAGGCTLEAAEAVVPDGELEAGDIAPAVADLVNRNLVTVQTYGETRRFVLLETVRDYALARLKESGETEHLRAWHLRWCRNLVRSIGTPDDFAAAESVAAVFAEWPNILAALENAPGTARAPEGLRLAVDMHVPWLARAWFREAQRHYAALTGEWQAGREAPDIPAHELAQALSHYGFHTLMVGDLESAAAQLAEAGELAAPLDDAELAQTVRYYQGIVDVELCRLPEAVARLREGERVAVRDTQGASFADALGTALLYAGDPAEALAAYTRSSKVDAAHDDEHGLSRGLSNQAKALLDLGRLDEALAVAEESDRYARRLDDRQILPLNDLTRAAAALVAGQLDAAESYCRAALAHEEEAAGLARVDLADVLIAKGETAAARTLLDEFSAAGIGGVPLLAARVISAVLLHAEGDRAAAQAQRMDVTAEFGTTGFGWRRYTDRLAALDRD
ncbi:AfsR/SARP family transcriptional regulator [Nocardia altamirensis]|uniref:AfsR/SARP family transcriptional regulator n=1 Tax=Nocardia altamirensis TaxID=472158 RepID=UPI0008408A63|nr:BTAD domain-containing putative transcriptional regulator [Nocardia altamirensis]